MKFLYCQKCGRLYPVHEVRWAKLPPLDWAEFTEEEEEQQEVCGKGHTFEIFVVFSDAILGNKDDIYRRTLVFCVINSAGVPAIVTKTRRSLASPPMYKYYSYLKNGGVPPEIGRLIDVGA